MFGPIGETNASDPLPARSVQPPVSGPRAASRTQHDTVPQVLDCRLRYMHCIEFLHYVFPIAVTEFNDPILEHAVFLIVATEFRVSALGYAKLSVVY